MPPEIDVPEGDTVGVSLITKTANNPFFIALNDAATATAAKYNVELTLSSGKADGDEDSQIQAVENAIARGDKGILITTNGPGVNPALEKAKAAGIELRSGGLRTGPLTAADLQRLGLSRMAAELSVSAGRPVTFMIFESSTAATARVPSILAPSL